MKRQLSHVLDETVAALAQTDAEDVMAAVAALRCGRLAESIPAPTVIREWAASPAGANYLEMWAQAHRSDLEVLLTSAQAVEAEGANAPAEALWIFLKAADAFRRVVSDAAKRAFTAGA